MSTNIKLFNQGTQRLPFLKMRKLTGADPLPTKDVDSHSCIVGNVQRLLHSFQAISSSSSMSSGKQFCGRLSCEAGAFYPSSPYLGTEFSFHGGYVGVSPILDRKLI
ncbi:hypothetical protein PRUPE_1G069200 [Prunus persica]|uniref:Uncharacterized protein n=1 Tax=Prunus persica TaxID=3760 RepID=A0A251QTN6_PRUPE|nr:hypothetical protein PRUPE_1G069200 [Prunus persica]